MKFVRGKAAVILKVNTLPVSIVPASFVNIQIVAVRISSGQKKANTRFWKLKGLSEPRKATDKRDVYERTNLPRLQARQITLF